MTAEEIEERRLGRIEESKSLRGALMKKAGAKSVWWTFPVCAAVVRGRKVCYNLSGANSDI
jgi:phage-related protein